MTMGLSGIIQNELNEGRKATDKQEATRVPLGSIPEGREPPPHFSSPLLRTAVPKREGINNERT
jgi:hypothetical protein